MAKAKLYEYYTELPSWAKGIVIVGGMAIVYFTTRTIFKRLRAAKDAQDSKRAVQDAEADRRRLSGNGMKASYSRTQYRTWANSLEQAYEGCDLSGQITWGADSPLGAVSFWSNSGYKTASIFNQLKNDVDYLELSIAWGVRTYDDCGYFTGDVKDVDLAKAIQDELTAREISNLNQILSKKGIKYRV
jgi:hypothetical protein